MALDNYNNNNIPLRGEQRDSKWLMYLDNNNDTPLRGEQRKGTWYVYYGDILLLYISGGDNISVQCDQQTKQLHIENAQTDKPVKINFLYFNDRLQNNSYSYPSPIDISFKDFQTPHDVDKIKSQLKDKLSFADQCKWSLKDIGRSFCDCCIQD